LLLPGIAVLAKKTGFMTDFKGGAASAVSAGRKIRQALKSLRQLLNKSPASEPLSQRVQEG
jgi:hypothetical protein